MWNPKIQAQTHILMIQSQTLLFSTILQATQMHILSPYSPGASTLKYNVAIHPLWTYPRVPISCVPISHAPISLLHLAPIYPTHLLGQHGVGAPPQAHHTLPFPWSFAI